MSNPCLPPRRWLLRLILVFGAVLLIYQAWLLTEVIELRSNNPEMTAFMENRLQEMQATNPKAKLVRIWVPTKLISPHAKRAVLVAEDASFYSHFGFDWEGIRVAFRKNIKRGHIVAGGSTISQQLAKNLFLSDERSLLRKAEETMVTLMLEAVLKKRRILELYLNYAEWGDGIFGIEAAAHHYFNVSANELDEAQSATLAAILPNPHYYGTLPPKLSERSSVILSYMVGAQTD